MDEFLSGSLDEVKLAGDINAFMSNYTVSILHLVLTVVILASTGLIYGGIRKFQNLQTRTNYILLNLFICITLFSICGMTVRFLQSTFNQPLSLYSYLFLSILIFGFLSACFLQSLILALDWFLVANCNVTYTKSPRGYKWLISATYLFLVVYIILFVIGIHQIFVNALASLICAIIFFSSVLILAVFNLIKFCRVYTQEGLKTAYALTVSNVFLLFWLPVMLVVPTGVFLTHIQSGDILSYIVLILELFAFCAPIVIIILLGKWNSDFQVFYDSIFKKSVPENVQSELEPINERSEPQAV